MGLIHAGRRRAFPTALAACLLVFPSLASAQSEEQVNEARALFTRGTEQFENGSFQLALESFQRVYELLEGHRNRALVLFNIARAHEELRRDEEALASYEAFLSSAAQDAPMRAEANERMIELRARLRARAQVTPAARPGPAGQLNGAPVALLVASGVLAIGGGVLVGVAVSDVAAVEQAPTGASWASVADAYSRSEPMSIAGIVALGTASALAVASIVWLLVDGDASRSTAVVVAPTPTGITVEGRF